MLWEPGWCPKILYMCKAEAYQDSLEFSLSFGSTSAKATLILKCFKKLPIFPQIPSTALEKIENWQVYKDFSKSFLLMKYRITALYYSSMLISHYSLLFWGIRGACHSRHNCKLVFAFVFIHALQQWSLRALSTQYIEILSSWNKFLFILFLD